MRRQEMKMKRKTNGRKYMWQYMNKIVKILVMDWFVNCTKHALKETNLKHVNFCTRLESKRKKFSHKIFVALCAASRVWRLKNLGISSEIASANFSETRESRFGIVCWVGSWTKPQTNGWFPKPTRKST